MTTQGYANPEILVETDWLESRLDDPNVRIVDCDPYDAYGRAHIKNAVGIPVHHYIKEPGYDDDPRGYPLVAPPDTMKEVMERMGIGDDNLVVAYDSNGALWSTRLWWVLNYYGHTNVRVLNGGWKKWYDEGRPTSISAATPREVTFTPKTNDSLVCTLDYGVANVGSDDVLFLHVRSDGEWDGSNSRGNARAGRIPGAVHLEWTNLLTEGDAPVLLPADDMRRILADHGITPDKNVITY